MTESPTIPTEEKAPLLGRGASILYGSIIPSFVAPVVLFIGLAVWDCVGPSGRDPVDVTADSLFIVVLMAPILIPMCAVPSVIVNLLPSMRPARRKGLLFLQGLIIALLVITVGRHFVSFGSQ